MNQESALAKVMLLELLFGTVQIKHEDDCLKKTNKFPFQVICSRRLYVI